MSCASVKKRHEHREPDTEGHLAPTQVLPEPPFDLLSLIDEVLTHRLRDQVWRQARLWLFGDRHDYRERLFRRNLLGCTQKICDVIAIKVALIEGRWISTIETADGSV